MAIAGPRITGRQGEQSCLKTCGDFRGKIYEKRAHIAMGFICLIKMAMARTLKPLINVQVDLLFLHSVIFID